MTTAVESIDLANNLKLAIENLNKAAKAAAEASIEFQTISYSSSDGYLGILKHDPKINYLYLDGMSINLL